MKLLEPISVGGLTLKNKSVMAPMGTNLSLVRGASRCLNSWIYTTDNGSLSVMEIKHQLRFVRNSFL